MKKQANILAMAMMLGDLTSSVGATGVYGMGGHQRPSGSTRTLQQTAKRRRDATGVIDFGGDETDPVPAGCTAEMVEIEHNYKDVFKLTFKIRIVYGTKKAKFKKMTKAEAQVRNYSLFVDEKTLKRDVEDGLITITEL